LGCDVVSLQRNGIGDLVLGFICPGIGLSISRLEGYGEMVAEGRDKFKNIDPVGRGKRCIDVKISEGMSWLPIGVLE